MSTFRIAIIGPKESIAGFRLLGADIESAYTPDEAVASLFRLKRMTKTDDAGRERNVYGIVYITEDLAAGIGPEDQKKLSRGALPAIVALPSHQGSNGYGIKHLHQIVERAIGSNILL